MPAVPLICESAPQRAYTPPAGPSLSSPQGRTPLLLAAANGHAKAVVEILKAGADKEAKNVCDEA